MVQFTLSLYISWKKHIKNLPLHIHNTISEHELHQLKSTCICSSPLAYLCLISTLNMTREKLWNTCIVPQNLGSFINILPYSRLGINNSPDGRPICVASWLSGMFLVVPKFVARYLFVRTDARDPSGEIWNCKGKVLSDNIQKWNLPRLLEIVACYKVKKLPVSNI
jgi:hypothetical protein